MNQPEHNRYYSANEVLKGEFLPWITSLPTLVRWIEEYPEVFNAIIYGKDAGRRYHIKGEDLLKIQKMARAGSLKFDVDEKVK